jgi:cell shape-determining protein MreC
MKKEKVKDSAILKEVEAEVSTDGFVKQSFEAVLRLHEEILWEKEERLLSLREENAFLKESLYAVQSIYDEDKTTIKLLSEQLKQTQEELEFMKRKYKMMWNQAVENYGKQK